jgi:hypothetical protein
LISIETFAFVFTGGKSRGCKKPARVGAAVLVAVVFAPEIRGPPDKRMPVPARAAASRVAKKSLTLILLY